MHFPKYWGKGQYSTTNNQGEPADFTCWHWSDVSVADAQIQAEQRAHRMANAVLGGRSVNRYSYGERPIREEVVQAIPQGGRDLGVVTRNAYGALVLNAANAMFIDIDFKGGDSGGGGLLGGLFGKPKAAPEAALLPTIEQWTRRYPGLGVRVYRTAAGLRCLIITDTFNPTDMGTQDMMKSLGGDPLYITLCRQQESFRARLTPKPWRCDTAAPPDRYPWESLAQERRYRDWEADYQRNAAPYAVCRLVASYGDNRVHPDVAPILALHDQYCNVQANLQLA